MLFSTRIHLPNLKKLVFKAAKLPIIYFLISIVLIALSYIDNFFSITAWKNIFDITDKVGNIFLALSVVTFFYKLLVGICRWYERQLQEEHKISSVILTSVRKSLRIIFILAAINIIISLAGPTKVYLNIANNVINAILIASLGWILIQIFYTLETVLYQKMTSNRRKEYARIKALYTKMHIIRNIATVTIIIITIAAILMSFHSVRSIGISMLASAGFITAIIGLSAQKTLFSLFSGLQIAISQPIKIGDMVMVEKDSGLVEEITFTYVTLKLGDRRKLIVPINYFIEKPFENWSRDANSLRCSFYLYVDYLMPIEPLRKKLDSILEHSAFWDGLAKKLQVARLTEKGVEIRIQISAPNADDLADLRAEVQEEMLNFLRDKHPHGFPAARNLSINVN